MYRTPIKNKETGTLAQAGLLTIFLSSRARECPTLCSVYKRVGISYFPVNLSLWVSYHNLFLIWCRLLYSTYEYEGCFLNRFFLCVLLCVCVCFLSVFVFIDLDININIITSVMVLIHLGINIITNKAAGGVFEQRLSPNCVWRTQSVTPLRLKNITFIKFRCGVVFMIRTYYMGLCLQFEGTARPPLAACAIASAYTTGLSRCGGWGPWLYKTS